MTIMGVAAFMRIHVVLWDARHLAKSGAQHQVIIHSPTADDPYKMKERFWTPTEILRLCEKHPRKVAHLQFNGVDHFDCRQADDPVEIPQYIVSAIEKGTGKDMLSFDPAPSGQQPNMFADDSSEEDTKKTLALDSSDDDNTTPPKKKTKTTTKTTKTTILKSSTLIATDRMPLKSDILRSCDIFTLEDDDDDDFSVDEIKQKGFRLGYNAFAFGSHCPDFDGVNYEGEDISYAHFFKLKHTTRIPSWTETLPDGVARLLVYSLE